MQSSAESGEQNDASAITTKALTAALMVQVRVDSVAHIRSIRFNLFGRKRLYLVHPLDCMTPTPRI